MEEMFNKCTLCPRECKVNRNNNELGYCRATNKLKIGGYHLHMWEEPIITKDKGSGTIFFSNCNLGCIYCQNYEISANHLGEEISTLRLSEIMLSLEQMGALNINLVTPTHYVPLIKEALIMAKEKGLSVPIIYNTSGYEKKETLKLLDGLIDIYLPDFKYYSNFLGKKYSKVDNYSSVAKEALEEMVREVGKPKYNKDGVLVKGVIVRHMLLPGHLDDSKKVIAYLYNTYKDDIIISIMNQYTPVRKCKYSNLNNKVTKLEYDELVNYAYDLGVRNAFIQDEESSKLSFIPSFKGDQII